MVVLPMRALPSTSSQRLGAYPASASGIRQTNPPRARKEYTSLTAMKAMMDMVGLNGGPVRPPLVNVAPDELDELRTILSRWEKYL